jgi:hypothetical protein
MLQNLLLNATVYPLNTDSLYRFSYPIPMFVPFDTLPPASRIWIFQANRPFSSNELVRVEETLRLFTNEWAAHGSPLKTSFAVKYDQFIILAADETHESPSGCSIDSSVRILKSLERELGIQLFDRNLIAFKSSGVIELTPINELKQKFQDGTLKEETLTFNNVVTTKSALDREWLVPAGSTWLKRYITNELAKVK